MSESESASENDGERSEKSVVDGPLRTSHRVKIDAFHLSGPSNTAVVSEILTAAVGGFVTLLTLMTRTVPF